MSKQAFARIVAKWILNEMLTTQRKYKLSNFSDIPITPEELASLLVLKYYGILTHKECRDKFDKFIKSRIMGKDNDRVRAD